MRRKLAPRMGFPLLRSLRLWRRQLLFRRLRLRLWLRLNRKSSS